MSSADVVKTLSSDHEEDEADEDPGNESVRIVAILVCDVAEGEDVQLLLPTASGRIDGEEDGPSDAASDKADNDGDLQVSQQEISVDGIMLKHEGVRHLVEGR